METVTDFIFLGSKITTFGDCCHDIKRRLLLERKAMTNLDSVLKSRDISLPTKVCTVEAVVFPIVMYACASWTIKKAEGQRTAAFQMWCWRRLLRVPWTATGLDQSFLKEINPEYSMVKLLLRLKLRCFGHLMQRADSLEKTEMLGKIEGRRKSGQQRMRWVDGIVGSTDEFEKTPGHSEGQGGPACPGGHKELDLIEWLNSSKEWYCLSLLFGKHKHLVSNYFLGFCFFFSETTQNA